MLYIFIANNLLCSLSLLSAMDLDQILAFEVVWQACDPIEKEKRAQLKASPLPTVALLGGDHYRGRSRRERLLIARHRGRLPEFKVKQSCAPVPCASSAAVRAFICDIMAPALPLLEGLLRFIADCGRTASQACTVLVITVQVLPACMAMLMFLVYVCM